MDNEWNSMPMSRIAERFAGMGIDWWIAGGCAIDLFLGWETRSHADVDIEMFRSHSTRLFDVFDGWDLHAVSEGGVVPWPDAVSVDDSVFGIWARVDPHAPWQVEVLLADGDTHEWRFRRDPSIAMTGSDLIRISDRGIPYSTPEVQLLYKSSQARRKDDVDLARCLVRMTVEQRTWLVDAIAKIAPRHPWLSVLGASLNEQHE